MGRIGETGCEATGWVSDSSLRCMAAGLHMGSLRVTATVGTRGGSVSEALSVDLASMSSVRSVSSLNLLPVGERVIYVAGSGLDGMRTYSGSAQVGLTGCESTEWASETSIECMTAAGVSTSLRLVATIGERTATLTDAMSYDGPEVSEALAGNRGGAVSSSATITGSGFGATMLSQVGQIGGTASEASEWRSDTSVVCKTTTVGIGHTQTASMTVGARTGYLTGAASYDGSRVSSLSGGNRGGAGSVARVTVQGDGLGTVDMSSAGRLGGTGCEASEWRSDTEMTCLSGMGVMSTRRRGSSCTGTCH